MALPVIWFLSEYSIRLRIDKHMSHVTKSNATWHGASGASGPSFQSVSDRLRFIASWNRWGNAIGTSIEANCANLFCPEWQIDDEFTAAVEMSPIGLWEWDEIVIRITLAKGSIYNDHHHNGHQYSFGCISMFREQLDDSLEYQYRLVDESNKRTFRCDVCTNYLTWHFGRPVRTMKNTFFGRHLSRCRNNQLIELINKANEWPSDWAICPADGIRTATRPGKKNRFEYVLLTVKWQKGRLAYLRTHAPLSRVR